MSSVLPAGVKLPVTFKPGQALTAEELNKLQTELLLLLLHHDHSGNDQLAPQGVVLDHRGLGNNAVRGQHIAPNAVAKGDIHNAAVGASEIQEKCIGSNHLVDGAVGTGQIKAKAVTLAKLADEVLALLNTPREGATTYGYCVYLDGLIAYPTIAGRWYDWLLEPTAPVRVHDLPIRRLRDDGGWQPIRSIMPPDRIRTIRPTAGFETAISPDATNLATETLRISGDLTVGSAFGIPGVAETAYRIEPITYRAPSYSLPASPTWNPSMKIPIDPVLFIDPNPSDDLLERNRVAMLVDPAAVGWTIAQEGTTFFQPGLGGNAPFSDGLQSIKFELGETPSKDELATIGRMLYHYDIIDDPRLRPETLLALPKFLDFLNNPHLLAAGYWTGASRNVRAVVRMRQRGQQFVRVRFATPYTDSSYVVTVTPDFRADDDVAAVVPAVLRRRPDYVDLAFLANNEPVNKLAFSITIHGELVER